MFACVCLFSFLVSVPFPLAQAAILHDTIEDTDTTRAELVQRFGEAVTSIVMEVSDDKALPKLQRKQLQIEHAPHKSSAKSGLR